jgi:sugar phosphate permease
MTGVYAAPVAVASVVSLIRNYGIGLISGPIAGWLAKAMHSPAKALMVISAVSILVMVVFMLLPRNPGLVVVVAILVVIAAFFAYGGYSIGTSTATEVKVPLRIFGMAGCMYSLIGFLPDVFIHPWFGAILDKQGDAGYDTMFIIMAISGVLAILCLMQVRRYVRKHVNDPDPQEEAAGGSAA